MTDSSTFSEMANEMRMQIPGKTFSFGEYIALHGGPCLIFTSKPMFELIVRYESSPKDEHPFHPDSPAGKWFAKHQAILSRFSFAFENPYQRGGLGASTAEFLGLYRLTQQLLRQTISSNETLLADYHDCCSNKGTLPSGADLIAQHHKGITFLHRAKNQYVSHSWPFDDLALVLCHTNKKLATHHHLENHNQNQDLSSLENIALQTYRAFQEHNALAFVKGIEQYGQTLEANQLIAPHTKHLIEQLSISPKVLAIKGCGAMGADVLMLLCKPHDKNSVIELVKTLNLPVLATEKSLAEETRNKHP